MRRALGPRSRGFIFLETMIATLILALILGATFRTVSRVAASERGAAEVRAAVLVARSVMAEVGVAMPLEPGVTRGISGAYVYEVTMEREPGQGGLAGPLTRVSVSVGTAERADIARVVTLKLPGTP